MSVSVVVIGNGTNEIVAAHYLAGAGHRVLLLRDPAPASETHLERGWIPPRVVADLKLKERGLAADDRAIWAAALVDRSERLELTNDVARTAAAIRRHSVRDAERWPDFCARMHALARLLETVYLEAPPDPLARGWRDRLQLGALAMRTRGLGRQGIEDLLRLLPMSIADLLDDWFESDVLKGVLGAGGVMHLQQGPRSGGTAFNFLHHHVGAAPGVFRQPLTNAARILGELPAIETREAKVVQIKVQEQRVCGVVLESGEEIACTHLVSGADPGRTLLEWIDAGWLDPELVRSVQRIRSRGVAAEVTLTLGREPGADALVLAPSLDYLERAYDDSKYGLASSAPWLEARAAAASDGGHIVNVHVQYVPYALRDGEWNETRAREIANAVIARLADYAPAVTAAVERCAVRGPLDLERTFGDPQGQPYHAELGLDQILWMRPVPALARYRTPIRGLYLCGPAMHPGGGIIGAAALNAVRVMLRDLDKEK